MARKARIAIQIHQSMDVLSTEVLWNLRKSLECDTGNDDLPIFHDLRQLRKEMTGELGQFELVIDLFRRCIALLSTLDSKHALYVPPLYTTPEVDDILRSVVAGLYGRELGQSYGASENTGHVVLGGVEGAGKTMLQAGFAIAAAALLTKLVPITLLVEESLPETQMPARLIADAVHLIDPEVQIPEVQIGGPTIKDSLKALGSTNHEAFLIIDEFQLLFTKDEDFERRRDATKQVASASRTQATFGLMAGSSVNMKSLVFKDVTQSQDEWRAVGYPDFNGTLYTFLHTPALRTAARLTEFCRTRYPGWQLAADDVCKLLAFTGGIGRLVHQIYERRALAVASPVHGLPSDDDCSITVADRRIKPQEATGKLPGFGVVVALLLSAQHDGPAQDCGGVAQSLLQAALQDAGVTDGDRLLESAYAGSLLYHHGDLVQFARPHDAHVYRNQLPVVESRRIMFDVVRLMVKGIDVGPGDVQTVNAGTALERLVRPRIYGIIFPGLVKEGVVDSTPFKMTASSFEVGGQPLTSDTLTQLHCKPLSWEGETGLDGVVLEVTETTVRVHGWQSKGGLHTRKVGAGPVSTALDNYRKQGDTLKTVDDTQFGGIAFKAQVGLCTVAAALRSTLGMQLPSMTVLPGMVVITTTKCRVEGLAEEIEVPVEEYLRNSFDLKEWKDPVKFKLITGTEWVRDSLEYPLSKFPLL